jgi:tRNA pseudouridine13 synthase
VPRLRAEPEDFRVDELPLYPPLGHGDHTFVSVEKRRRTTEDVANSLARLAGVKPRDVGYAGRKDREAVTTQWFSVPGLDPDRAIEFSAPGLRVIEADRHPHKLRTGQLRGNRFRIVVRDIDAAASERSIERFEALASDGMPNRFGPQRFGRDGENVAKAQQILKGESPRIDRRTARFLISALQSAVFNEALRSRDLPLGALELGDVAMVHESGGSFVVEDLDREAARAATFEISATGPIFGPRLLSPTGRPALRERAAFARFGVDVDALRMPRGIKLRGARRLLRVRPSRLDASATGDVLELGFELPPGSYASVLLEEVLAPEEALPPRSG